jgi:hypothetical protein
MRGRLCRLGKATGLCESTFPPCLFSPNPWPCAPAKPAPHTRPSPLSLPMAHGKESSHPPHPTPHAPPQPLSLLEPIVAHPQVLIGHLGGPFLPPTSPPLSLSLEFFPSPRTIFCPRPTVLPTLPLVGPHRPLGAPRRIRHLPHGQQRDPRRKAQVSNHSARRLFLGCIWAILGLGLCWDVGCSRATGYSRLRATLGSRLFLGHWRFMAAGSLRPQVGS